MYKIINSVIKKKKKSFRPHIFTTHVLYKYDLVWTKMCKKNTHSESKPAPLEHLNQNSWLLSDNS